MKDDEKGEYDSPLYGDPDARDVLRLIVVLVGIFGGFFMGVIVGRFP